jgi:hypothetical protein
MSQNPLSQESGEVMDATHVISDQISLRQLLTAVALGVFAAALSIAIVWVVGSALS